MFRAEFKIYENKYSKYHPLLPHVLLYVYAYTQYRGIAFIGK